MTDAGSSGLSTASALRQREIDGFNELPTVKTRRIHQIAVELVREPMAFLLLACGGVYFVLGDRQEALMLLGFLLIILMITLFQERKAERALEALRRLSSPRALVLRDGKKQRIPGREVVRGDIVFVNEGDRVPADGISLSKAYVSVDESLLTGESVPVDKELAAKLHAGTTVTRGQAVMRVTETGSRTLLGGIGRSIQETKTEPTQLERQTRKLVRKLAIAAGLLCAGVAIVYALTRGDWLNGILAGLSLAMAILPNELPAVLTIFLALGAWRISQRGVLTRKIPAIENLGATTVLCVDKTGTLTLNRMTLRKLFVPERELDLSDWTEDALPEEYHELIEYGILASQQDPFDPMERAFVSAGSRFLKKTEHLHPEWALEREYPLTPELLAISHAWRPSPEGGHIVGAKGAPEAIVDLCHLTPAFSAKMLERAQKMADEGSRVLGVAKAKRKSPVLPGIQHDFEFELLGLVGLEDPIRPEVPQAVRECREAGIRVVMITGDHPNTAGSIARQIGLEHPDEIVTGSELEGMSFQKLAEVAHRTNVFSRMVPEQKYRLVQALKKNGEVVAMTGDGVNDAPALRVADIGVAMGERGTDVARESAAIVLLRDDFISIVEAIRMGRRTYANLQDAFVYLLAVHVPIAGISVLPVMLKLPLVLLPVHIAFLHLIIEPACSIVFESEPAGESVMRTPPRKAGASFFSREVFGLSLLQGFNVLVALLVVFVFSLLRGKGEREARALTFTVLIFANLAFIISSRGISRPLKIGKVFRNRTIPWIIGGALALLGAVLYVAELRSLFKFSALHATDILICLIIGITSVFAPQLNQFYRRRSTNEGK